MPSKSPDASVAGAGGNSTSLPHAEAWQALCHAHAGLTGRLQETLTEAGLPPLPWFEVLDAVAGAPEEGMRMGDLADSLVISRGGLTKLVDRLVKAGLVRRGFCEGDRRVSYAMLTPAGREMHEEMRPVVVGELRTAFHRSLSARQAAALRDSLVKLTAASCSS
ncbi:MAG TPA: MarR family transcriptional regulator [Solirubrobacterales bacterium]|jgi:DNA-binding MarR family transcriptional regulator